MTAFVPALSVAARSRVSPATSSFTPALPDAASRRPSAGGVRMSLAALRLRRVASAVSSKAGGFAQMQAAADDYMARSVTMQYKATACPTGVYGTQCTEGTTKGAAEASRVAALAASFRATQRGPAEKTGRIYEMRRMALLAAGNCHYEEQLIVANPKMAESYSLGKMEAKGTCSRYAIPESTEEAAMVNYIDIQQKNRANNGVYTTACQEGTYKGAAEDARVACLATSFRNAQKPSGQLLQEKYNQSQYGFQMSNGCTYEDGIYAKYPAVAANMRSKAYGY